jgi:hypothetical protein
MTASYDNVQGQSYGLMPDRFLYNSSAGTAMVKLEEYEIFHPWRRMDL